MAENIEPAPSTQATYSDSDLASIDELIGVSRQRGGWSKLAGGITNIANNTVNIAIDTAGLSANILTLSDTGIAGNNLNLEWGQDHSGRGISQQNNPLLVYNKTAVGKNEDLAERIIDKLKASGLIELSEMAGRNSRIR
jgi:hypothetical protein